MDETGSEGSKAGKFTKKDLSISTFGVPKVKKFEIRISKSEITAPTEHLTRVLFTRRFEICHA
jgi:hypothetical protein